MAIQDKTLSGAEFDWYATRSGLTQNAPLNEHKVKYFSDKGFGSNASLSKPIQQMERDWVQSVGSSGNVNEYESWTAACQAESVPVGGSINECKFNFYTTVTSSP